VIRYLIDSSALWRVMRSPGLRAAWADVIAAGAIGSCEAQRTEFRRSARDSSEYDEMNEMFVSLYPDVPVSKTIWRWVEGAQYRLVRAGVHRALSTVDLLICGVASHAHLTVLHDDSDFVTASRHLDVRERSVRDRPSAG
jgi:predicted nucleic acid-binding protein